MSVKFSRNTAESSWRLWADSGVMAFQSVTFDFSTGAGIQTGTEWSLSKIFFEQLSDEEREDVYDFVFSSSEEDFPESLQIAKLREVMICKI